MGSSIRGSAPVVLLTGFLVGTAGCGAASDGTSSDAGVFIAYARDFGGFRDWPAQSFENPAAQGSTHVAGPRTVYINQLPPAGSDTFPLRTMIVKVTDSDGQIFARVKRGGGYNRNGATEWEWFELLEGTNGVSIKWQGVGPPAGEKYGGDPNSGCNPCHAAAKNNDYVLSPWLQLDALGATAGDGGDADVDGGVARDSATTPEQDAADAGAPGV